MRITSYLAAERAAQRSKLNPPLVSAGKFNRSAIMREAVTIARSLRAGGATWGWRMRIGLESAWRRAKAEMKAAKEAAAFEAECRQGWTPPAYRPRSRFAPFVFERGSRSTSHGW